MHTTFLYTVPDNFIVDDSKDTMKDYKLKVNASKIGECVYVEAVIPVCFIDKFRSGLVLNMMIEKAAKQHFATIKSKQPQTV